MTTLTTLKRFARVFIGSAVVAAAGAASVHAQAPAGVTIHADSADGGDVAIAALFADGSKKAVTTVQPGQDATIPFDAINFGKAQRIEVFAEDCNGQKTVVLVQPGAEVKGNCKRRFIGVFLWGHESHFEVHFGPQILSNSYGPGVERPLFDDGEFQRTPTIVPYGTGLFGFPSLTNTGHDCANVVNEFQTDFDLTNTNCTFPSRAGMWGVGGGVHITPFLGAGFFFESIGTLHLTAIASASPSVSLNNTATFGPAHFFGITGEVRYPFGPIVPYGTFGYARWTLDQTADLFVLRGGQRTLDTPSSAHDSGWSPVLGFGVGVDLTRSFSIAGGYERLTMSNSKNENFKKQDYNQLKVEVGVNLRR